VDDQRFDDLARLLAPWTTRRRIVRAVVAAALVGLLRPGAGAAKPGGDACIDEGGKCASSVLCCEGLRCCKNHCRDVLADRKNCGSCGHACHAGQTCCLGHCVDLASDWHNCGTCGNRCPPSGAIEEQHQICCDGICVNPHSDEHCGECGHVCAEGTTCCKGDCVAATRGDCPDGQMACCDNCLDLNFSDYNCGACHHRCYGDDGNYTGPCTNGTCGCAETGEGCQEDLHCCQGRCVDGTCHPCRLPGSACREDFDCCGGHGSGRCVDATCRCCQYGQDESFFCNGAIGPAEVPCCEYPRSAVECVSPTTGECTVVCGVGPDGACPPGYEETGFWADYNHFGCTTGF
jgi:hypothetical protein